MSRHAAKDRESRIRGARAAPSPLGPGDCPLEALREVHFLQRQICLDMEVLADSRIPRPALAREVLMNLCRDLPLHHADEDLDLFPLLRARALPEDEIDPLLDCLSADHLAEPARLAALLAALACLADGALPAPEDRSALRALAQAERRHMTIENAIVLPLAAARLTDADRQHLRAAMATRRAAPPDPLRAPGPCRRFLSGAQDIPADRQPEGTGP